MPGTINTAMYSETAVINQRIMSFIIKFLSLFLFFYLYYTEKAQNLWIEGESADRPNPFYSPQRNFFIMKKNFKITGQAETIMTADQAWAAFFASSISGPHYSERLRGHCPWYR